MGIWKKFVGMGTERGGLVVTTPPPRGDTMDNVHETLESAAAAARELADRLHQDFVRYV